MLRKQLLSPTAGVLKLWRHTRRSYAGDVPNKSKGLGVAQRGLNVSSHVRRKRICEMRSKAKRVSALRSGRKPRVTVTRVGLHASSMYACDVDPLTMADIHQLRLGTAACLHLERGPNNRVAAMLLTPPGLVEPRTHYFDRAMLNWRRQMAVGIGPSKAACDYWHHVKAGQGKTTGAIHLVLKLLHQCGIVPTQPTPWLFPILGRSMLTAPRISQL